MDAKELVVTEVAEVVKHSKWSTIQTVAKYGGIAALAGAAIFGVYCAGASVIGFMKRKRMMKMAKAVHVDQDDETIADLDVEYPTEE